VGEDAATRAHRAADAAAAGAAALQARQARRRARRARRRRASGRARARCVRAAVVHEGGGGGVSGRSSGRSRESPRVGFGSLRARLGKTELN